MAKLDEAHAAAKAHRSAWAALETRSADVKSRRDSANAEIDATMDIAVQAHLQKRAKIAEMMSGPGAPLWQIVFH